MTKAKQLARIASGVIALLIIVGGGITGDAAQADNECAPRVVVDYRKAFSGLPAVREAPKGPLPFSVRRAELYPVWSDLLLDGGFVGYALSIDGKLSNFRPDWVVSARLRRISKAGLEGATLRSFSRRLRAVKNLEELDFSLKSNFGVGVYKYQLTFESSDRKRLGVFARYVRVMPRRVKVRLNGPTRTEQPGEEFEVQLENLGTSQISYSEAFITERLSEGRWEKLANPPQRTLRGAARIEPGYTGRCLAVQVPADAVPGAYRVRSEISTLNAQRPRSVFFHFDVAG